jgi:hypothetical protein
MSITINKELRTTLTVIVEQSINFIYLPLLVEKAVYVSQFFRIFEAQRSHHGALLHSRTGL